MSRTTAPPLPPIARPATATALRIRIGDDATASAALPVRRYVDPHVAAAFVEPAPLTDAPPPAWPEPTNGTDVLVSPDRRPSPATDAWLAVPDHPDAPLPATVEVDGGRIRWRPGRAVLEGPIQRRDDLLPGLADFTFYEAQLRRLEAALPAHEAAAARDAPFAYRIADRDRDRWDRFGRTIEELATLRLTFARLEPRLGRPSRSLPPDGRRVFARLCTRAQIDDRLCAVSDRLEACEDVYEGAVDRITDHRWWRKGHRLEMIIVALLAIEGAQLAVELVLHLLKP
jgi:hypothetical protein